MYLWPWMKDWQWSYTFSQTIFTANLMGISWSFWNNQTFIISMIQICVTLIEGQGQYNEHMMHVHVWGSHRAKFNDDFNSFQEIACERKSTFSA